MAPAQATRSVRWARSRRSAASRSRVSRAWGRAAADGGAGTVWFPVVGAVLGAIAAGAGWVLAGRLPPLVAAVLVVALAALLNGALHLDGLADVCDGFGGGRSREDVLRIMRD